MSFPVWQDGRWHLAGNGIHAGDLIECLFPDGTWLPGRIESAEGGKKLFFNFDFHGKLIVLRVDPDTPHRMQIRWEKR